MPRPCRPEMILSAATNWTLFCACVAGGDTETDSPVGAGWSMNSSENAEVQLLGLRPTLPAASTTQGLSETHQGDRMARGSHESVRRL